MKIFAVYCPSCEKETPISTKNKEVLKEMKVECNNCPWKGLASEGNIKEKKFDDWF